MADRDAGQTGALVQGAGMAAVGAECYELISLSFAHGASVVLNETMDRLRGALNREQIAPNAVCRRRLNFWEFVVSRHKAAKFEARKLSEDELLTLFDQSLSALAHLASIYDGGFHPIALQMATEVHKLLTQDSPAMRLRKMRLFTTVDMGDQTRMLNAMHKLVGARLGGEPPRLDFIADFQMARPDDPAEVLTFKDWWNRDVIYRASAALPGTAPGMIPVNDTKSVPFDKRETINRRDFVALLRNKLGAHQDDDLPILLDQLEEARSWGDFVCDTPDGILSTQNGTLTTGATIMAAMMRQIAHEVLIAYGRDDPPTLFEGATPT